MEPGQIYLVSTDELLDLCIRAGSVAVGHVLREIIDALSEMASEFPALEEGE